MQEGFRIISPFFLSFTHENTPSEARRRALIELLLRSEVVISYFFALLGRS